MKAIKGNLLVFGMLIITLIVWLTAVPAQDISSLDRVRHIVAGISLSGLCLVLLLSTRNKTIESWFNGLNKVYVYHKWIAIFSVVLLFVHVILGDSLKTSEALSPSLVLAGLGMFLLVIITLLTLFNKKMKYETWRLIHRFMVLAFLAGTAHMYLSNRYNLLQFNVVSIWTGIISLVGICSGVYTIFFYQKSGFIYSGKVTAINKLTSSITEIEITLDQKMDYVKGQYIFVKVFQNGIENAPHPFSISGGDGRKVLLTIKNSGDFTQQINNELVVGTKVVLDGPYGHMAFSQGKINQLWIAGGIGITPFMAYLKGNGTDKSIEMYYSYNGKSSEAYKNFLEDYQKNNKNFKVNFIDTSTGNKLNFGNYTIKENTEIFMCGPAGMMSNFAKIFKNKNKNIEIVYEGFKFK
ncbi:MAG: ferric reductase-like transmembrane domain-containing protein [Flexilinea sp.]